MSLKFRHRHSSSKEMRSAVDQASFLQVKGGINTLFAFLQFMTPFTHVSRYPGAWNIKQKNCVETTVLIIWSHISNKMA